MAWVSVPKEHHPLFLAALPQAPDVNTMPMFGGIAVTVNGNIAGGLFGRSVMLRLPLADAAIVLAMDGASHFDPMGRGMKQPGKVMLPEDMMSDRRELARWLDKAIALARTLPPKKKGTKKASAKKASAKKASAKKASAKKATATKATARKAPARKAPAKRTKKPAR